MIFCTLRKPLVIYLYFFKMATRPHTPVSRLLSAFLEWLFLQAATDGYGRGDTYEQQMVIWGVGIFFRK